MIPCDIRQREWEKFGEVLENLTAVRVITYPGVGQVAGQDATHIFSEAQTVPGSSIDLYSGAVPAGKIWFIQNIELSCRREATFKITINGSVIGKSRTGPGIINSRFSFLPIMPIQGGTTVVISVESGSYAPASDANSTLMYTETAQ